jgi:hypothetical protein
MDVEIVEHPGSGNCTLILGTRPRIHALTEHSLRDLEFVLAQRRAMIRRCPATSGEHTCGNAPGHCQEGHLCRACTRTWQGGAR